MTSSALDLLAVLRHRVRADGAPRDAYLGSGPALPRHTCCLSCGVGTRVGGASCRASAASPGSCRPALVGAASLGASPTSLAAAAKSMREPVTSLARGA